MSEDLAVRTDGHFVNYKNFEVVGSIIQISNHPRHKYRRPRWSTHRYSKSELN